MNPDDIFLGPLLRRAQPGLVVVCLATFADLALRFSVKDAAGDELGSDVDPVRVRVSSSLFFWFGRIRPSSGTFPAGRLLSYAIGVRKDGAVAFDEQPFEAIVAADELAYREHPLPTFFLQQPGSALSVLYGSCRKIHDAGGADALAAGDALVDRHCDDLVHRPTILCLGGDQIYADDVHSLVREEIERLTAKLGLDTERMPGRSLEGNRKAVLAGDAKFTSDDLANHVARLGEYLALYGLSWNIRNWAGRPAKLAPFTESLPRVRRLLANVPTYMIFDDHDVTDDWNLSALWESTAYGHPFSRRIVGNALIGYLLCQGWGNDPDAFKELMPVLETLLNGNEPGALLAKTGQDLAVERVLAFQHWHYRIATQPPLIVLNTRTRRWRSDIVPGQPSGLMDWEALTEFQQAVMDERSVVVVSPAPMFGVKLIEAVQRIYTLFGKPLLVDAENWMAHRGAANVLLNIFGHSRTPQNFVILSGDVHYSFVYDVRLRHMKQGPRIWQITSSGIKNQFPNTLLEWLDRTNRWLYAPWSPLNWFTKRRRMRVTPWLPDRREAGERLWNRAGIGLVELDAKGVPTRISQLGADGSDSGFQPSAKPINLTR